MVSSLSAPLTPEANAAEQSRMELQARLNGLGGLDGRKLNPEAKAKKLREACEGFESIFIQKMWQEMRNTVPKSGLLSGREEKFWQDMYDQELSKSMTKAGGIGLADMMFEQLSRGLANASSQAANSSTGQAFVPTAAPLMTPVQEEAFIADAGSAKVISPAAIYDGAAPETASAPEEPRISQPVPHTPRPQNLTHAETRTRQPGSNTSTLGGLNGIQQAYIAQREAGDKLSSTGIRPALRAQKKTPQPDKTEEAAPGADAPGSAQGLAQALELAKNGAGIQNPGQTGSLTQLVNEAKARNALRDSLDAKAAQTMATLSTVSVPAAQGAQEGQPVVRKTRFTTNVPRTAASKKGGEAIRLLNVDNVGVNSKQGQGLAQWHTQQAAMPQAQTLGATHPGGQNLAAPEPAAPITPLTANDAPAYNGNGNYAIPPLRPGELAS